VPTSDRLDQVEMVGDAFDPKSRMVVARAHIRMQGPYRLSILPARAQADGKGAEGFMTNVLPAAPTDSAAADKVGDGTLPRR
jgi:hypothetical protein